MSVKMSLWKVSGDDLEEVQPTRLELEQRLENWLSKDASLTGLDVLIIGRQVQSEFGGRIDLLGMDEDGSLVVFELKRDKTPRDIVAQTLDYAGWVKDLSYDEVVTIAAEHLKTPLASAFQDHFGTSLPQTLNGSHSLVIVAAELDDASERIVEYLSESYGVNINAIYFNFFKSGDQELLGRAWFRDPEEVQVQSTRTKQAPWTGYWFVNVGETGSPHRNWEDHVRYGYLSAGQGAKYSTPLTHLNVGDKVFAYITGRGYVGFGEVTQRACPIKQFVPAGEEKTLLELDLKAERPGENADDPAMSEWCVGIKWIKTFPREQAKTFKGVFANQNIVCKLRHPETVQFVKKEFGVE